MRVIAGVHKGRILKTPTWDGLRPTSDRLRETLFNVLAPRVRDARVMDAYAGTGALGIEALSRGAAHVTFVEADRRAQALIEENLGRCRIENGYAIIRAPAGRAFETIRRSSAFTTFDIVLLDPPYEMPADVALAGVDSLIAPDGLVVLEHAKRTDAPSEYDRLVCTRRLVSGDSALAFYACRP
ncbi:MAG: 16S rRNA (guanine(966)-N(2))-methyltransferase RsmD [Vicinamibacterales bacterium]